MVGCCQIPGVPHPDSCAGSPPALKLSSIYVDPYIHSGVMGLQVEQEHSI